MAQDGGNKIERWHEIKDKLDAVLKLAPEQRPAYLDQVSTADPELRRELESLIARVRVFGYQRCVRNRGLVHAEVA